ncbi:uncharacterized protein LOC126994846 [Eriocheir sinensis]|uniref:uncharacterized protein LOC126994846 n=1 Tax=Eriocheir sinensis TaxID=95602 RepID=UPI0021C5C572|nr:uncharacterized protein LOC126994846 [Eriocheir sinensis]
MGEVTGDWLTLTVHGLTPSRKYLHKMHTHNVKGFGPFSSVESFTTSSVGGSCSESNKPGVQPPDLWIHHGHLELKNFDKGERSNSPNHASIIQHTAEDQQQGDDGARPDAWGTPGGSAGQGQGNKEWPGSGTEAQRAKTAEGLSRLTTT